MPEDSFSELNELRHLLAVLRDREQSISYLLSETEKLLQHPHIDDWRDECQRVLNQATRRKQQLQKDLLDLEISRWELLGQIDQLKGEGVQS